jgi:purine nucleosidase
VVSEFDITLVDWGVCVRDSMVEGEAIDDLAGVGTPYAEFFGEIASSVRTFTEHQFGVDATTQPDSLTVAVAIDPGIVSEAGTYFVDVDEREGMTRGYSLVDELGVTDGEPRTRVVESVDEERFREMFAAMVRHGEPERPLE